MAGHRFQSQPNPSMRADESPCTYSWDSERVTEAISAGPATVENIMMTAGVTEDMFTLG